MAASLDSMWEGVDAVPPVQRDVLSKTRLTDWDLMRGLGEGEFAKVQACRRRGETVVRACKHISKQRLICQSNVKRTLRRVRRVGTEIEAMRKLRHKSICQIFDVVHTPDYVHIVMENGGRDLYEIIGERRDDQVSLTFASEIGHALASGLGHCQEHGVVHRDVKPEVRPRTRPRAFPLPRRPALARARAHETASRDRFSRRMSSSASTRTTPTACKRSSCATLGCARSRA